MRWMATVAALVLAACSGGGGRLDNRNRIDPDSEDGGTPDGGGSSDDGGDPGDGDAGEDGGTDGGVDAGPIPLPTVDGWTFYATQHGGPRRVRGVTADSAGNIWVAGDSEGLFLLEPGATEYKRFTVADGLTGYIDPASPGGVQGHAVISVAGGPANTVFVGYRGVNDDGEDEDDPEWMIKSGDADRVVYDGAGLTVTHYDLSSPPGFYPRYPDGREKVRHVRRILYDGRTGDVWFGCDHGVAMFQARGSQVWEHQHVLINGFKTEDPAAPIYEMSGDWWGIALDPGGDLWMGGAHRVGKLHYASEGGNFWGSITPVDGIDVWPDAVRDGARPHQRDDDHISELVADSGGVWVGSSERGLARIGATGGISHIGAGQLVGPSVTSLERDPKDGSLWIGHMWGGMTRLQGGAFIPYSRDTFGSTLINSEIWDIQSGSIGGQRIILVAFSGGVIGVYTGD